MVEVEEKNQKLKTPSSNTVNSTNSLQQKPTGKPPSSFFGDITLTETIRRNISGGDTARELVIRIPLEEEVSFDEDFRQNLLAGIKILLQIEPNAVEAETPFVPGALRENIGDIIRRMRLRTGRGLTQTELAKKIGVDKSTLFRWENNVITPKASKLLKIAEVCGRSLEEFYHPLDETGFVPGRLREDIAQIIIRIRTENELTEGEFAKKVGTDPIKVSQWESNDKKPNKPSLRKIANAFGLSLEEFYHPRPDVNASLQIESDAVETESSFIPGPLRENIGKLIRRVRRERDLSQSEFADKIGVNKATICRWENGLSKPQVAYLPKIAEVCGCSLEELSVEEFYHACLDETDIQRSEDTSRKPPHTESGFIPGVLRENIGEIIRRKRRERDLGQSELADKIGVDKATIFRWEKGLSKPHADPFPKIAEVCGCSLEEFYHPKDSSK